MISIFKKKASAEVDFSALGIDMHSHLLPGIDDGAPDVSHSLELIQGLLDLGFKKFITTPHIMTGLYPNSEDTIQTAFEQLKIAGGNNIPVQPAAEYFLDESFDQLLHENKPLLCIHDKTVLVEFSFVTMPLNYKEKIFDMQIKGYQPLLAHPERYLYFSNHRAMFDDLRDAGCQFACNLLSFTGYYGKVPVELANYLLKKDYIDYLGTDLHHQRHLHALRNAQSVMPVVQKLTDAGRLLNGGILPAV